MSNTIGKNICVTLFGESHGTAIGAVLDGLSPGVSVDEAFISSQLEKRKPKGKTGTARREGDEFQILSGVFNGKTNGAPLCLVIFNQSAKSSDYEKLKDLPRPGHADYTAEIKYAGFQDYRGGGHFSGRLTAPLVAVGAIAISALKEKGIFIGTHVKKCAGIEDRDFSNLTCDLEKLNASDFAVLDDEKAILMQQAIEKAAAEGDSVGGVLETAVTGLTAGLGEPWFDSLESVLSHYLFSIPAVKGVEFGLGFAFADKKGSEANDAFRSEGGKIITATNNNGGINGGLSNGMPLLFRCVIKPTPSIYKEQNTVNLQTKENTTLKIEGRHDPAIVHRARIVVDSLVALALCDQIFARYGENYLASK